MFLSIAFLCTKKYKIMLRYLYSPYFVFYFLCIYSFLNAFFICIESTFSCLNFYKYDLFDITRMHSIKYYIVHSFTHEHKVFMMIGKIGKQGGHCLSDVSHSDAFGLTNSWFPFFTNISLSENFTNNKSYKQANSSTQNDK